MNEKKITKTDILEYDIKEIFEGKLQDVIGEIQGLQRKWAGTKYFDLSFSVDYPGYDYGFEVKLIGKRMETDSELAKRIANRNKDRERKKEKKKKKEEKDLALYEQLKAKYG